MQCWGVKRKKKMCDKMIRPLWPYGEWTTCREGSEETLHIHQSIVNKGDEIFNGLQTFLRVFDKDLELFDDKKGRAIQKEINEIMETAVLNLKQRSPLFRSCQLKRSGSVVEGTKVGEMNEFDFLLVLETLKIEDIEVEPKRNIYIWLKVIQEEETINKENSCSGSQNNGSIDREVNGSADKWSVVDSTTVEANSCDWSESNGSADTDVAVSGLADKGIPADSMVCSECMKSTDGHVTSCGTENNEPIDTEMKLCESHEKECGPDRRANSEYNDLVEEFASSESEKNSESKSCDSEAMAISSADNKVDGRVIATNSESDDETGFSGPEDYSSLGPLGMIVAAAVKKLDVDGRVSVGNDELNDTTDTHNKCYTLLSSDDPLMKATRASFQYLISEEVRIVLDTYYDWKLINFGDLLGTSSACSSGNATTLHLRSDKYNLNVDVDVCFCIPLSEKDIDNIMSPHSLALTKRLRFREETKRYLNFIKSVMHFDPEQEVFAIIGGENKFSESQSILTRICIPGLEHSPFQRYGRESGQVKTYRYAKCITSVFFPKEDEDCTRCSHCILKSYHLKNIILYMINNHKDPYFWNDINVPNRVIEIFDILSKCTQNRPHGKGTAAEIATFSTPGSLKICRFFNYCPVPSFFEGEEHSYKLFIGDPDGFSAAECSFWPEYNEKLKTDNTSIDDIVKSHFEDFQNEQWDSATLICWVKDLLHKLRDIRISSRL